MKVQSLSIVVPAKRCINDCKFCVAKMCNDNDLYKDQMDENLPFFDLYLSDYLKRLEYCRDIGVHTVMLTGNAEPQQNRKFLTFFGMFQRMMRKPFRHVEMQTTGTLIDENFLRFLRNHVGVNLISLSISSFDDAKNIEYTGMKVKVNLKDLAAKIKKYDFSLRLSINLTDEFDRYTTEEIFKIAKEEFLADQITFRVLYTSPDNTAEDKWIKAHAAKKKLIDEIKSYVTKNGTALGILEYGQILYSVNGCSTVIDDDCMSKELKQELKYLILRPNCKLYSKWDDKASLDF